MKNNEFKTYLFTFYAVYFLVGIFVYKDFGVGIEEHFQRKNGFYWLNYFFSKSIFTDFASLVSIKYSQILQVNPDLPDSNFFNFYGIIFDLPLAFIETLFKIESSKLYFEMRHLASFLIFFISSIFFYKIIKKRFNNNLLILLGLFFYVSSPRIFGDSFHNNKDILFLSILTISISYLFKLFENSSNRNIILFCFFSALATSTRIMGIYLPILLILFYFLEYLIDEFSIQELFKKILKIVIIFYLFLLVHYPYIWDLSIFEINSWFKSFFYWMDIKILFNGDYYSIKYLPRSYLLTWMIISIPSIILILFLIGFFTVGKTIHKRLINIEENQVNKKGDLWNSLNEKKDLFIFISFLSFFLYATVFNVAMLSGWRHFYFLHIFIIYMSIIGINYIYGILRNINLKILYGLCILLCSYLIFLNFKFHPYQSLYFIKIINFNFADRFQVDTPSLSRADALKFIIKKERENNKKIRVANASWTPMHNGRDMLYKNDKDKLIFVGQEYDNADYIYTNYIYKSNEKYNKNFKIPDNFRKVIDYKIDKILIYSIYEKVK